MQATAKMPVVTEGTACVPGTDQFGAKADLSLIYGCQGGFWVRLNYVPTVTEGAACGSLDKFGLTAGNAKMVTCQAGVWTAQGGGIVAGGGKSQLWKALAGKTTQCSRYFSGFLSYTRYHAARVDANGIPSLRVYSIRSSTGALLSDTGWISANTIYQQTTTTTLTMNGMSAAELGYIAGTDEYGNTTQTPGYVWTCQANWP